MLCWGYNRGLGGNSLLSSKITNYGRFEQVSPKWGEHIDIDGIGQMEEQQRNARNHSRRKIQELE